MNSVSRTLRAAGRRGLAYWRIAVEAVFENPALGGVVILGGLTIFWVVEGNVYGIVSSLVAMAVTLAVAVRTARR